jgi:hypothetical protein
MRAMHDPAVFALAVDLVEVNLWITGRNTNQHV